MYSPCSIVVPVYNSEATLSELTQRLEKTMRALCPSFELILVNDGSRDQSWEVIQLLVQQYPWIKGINMMRNYGQHNATLCGVRAAQYETIVTMDDDLQHPPEEIGKLLKQLEMGFDVVYGIPVKLPHSWWRNMASWLTKNILASAMNIPTIRSITAFRSFRTELRKAFEKYEHPGVILDVLLSWGTTRFTTAVVEEKPRQVGASNYNLPKLINSALFVLTSFSTLPLRLASYLGFGATFFGILILAYVLFTYFTEGSIPGFTFLASIVVLFSGVQLLSLGIFGEYLARMFDRSLNRPTYVIGKIYEHSIPCIPLESSPNSLTSGMSEFK